MIIVLQERDEGRKPGRKKNNDWSIRVVEGRPRPRSEYDEAGRWDEHQDSRPLEREAKPRMERGSGGKKQRREGPALSG
jgi:hypothetical protein